MAKSDVLVASPLTGTGGILVAPTSTALPTDTSTVPNAAFNATGYVGEDGLSLSVGRDTEKIKAWGGDTVRVVETSHEVTLSWTFLETNSLVLAEVYGAGNVTTTPATSTKGTLSTLAVKGGALPERAYIFEMKDGNKRVRVVAPNFQITEVGDTQFVHSAATGYEVTGEALPDSSGVKLYIYTDDGVTTA